ncbi:MAG: DUF4229 domain-containing protein [Caldilineaceae bacterium]|nr:DUF4229 domain-containing protein [Caldilineaceae bacterium]MBP8106325.1 DUF4229 domain-containing protein [Caldilineaceae bacterium]MBP9071119.1 DUF4229 domain-containing protein [Caldilineaceae bacterium]
MSENKSIKGNKTEMRLRISLFVIGFGIGWLTGMSASPVVNIVIAAIVGVIAALSSGRGTKENADVTSGTASKVTTITLGQLAWVVGGIVIGTTVGLTVRTHNLFSAIPGMQRNTTTTLEVQTWAELTKLDEQVIAKRLFDNTYPYRDYKWEMSQADVQDAMEFWSSVGISSTTTAERLFALQYLADTAKPNPIEPTKETATFSVFYSGASDSTCESMRKNLLRYDGNIQLALRYTPQLEILSIITDTVKLRTFVDDIVCDLDPLAASKP